MAQSFGVNSSQANAQFEAIATALNKIQKDSITKGRGDKALNTASSARAAQNGVIRTPWIMSTTEWLTQNPPKGLAWEHNPGDISWTMAQRSMLTKTVVGTVLHVWPNPTRNTFFDEPRITLNLQTGSLMPIIISNNNFPFINATTNKFPSAGCANFYDFMQLVDAPKLTIGDANTPPRANLVSIQYSSKIFPKLTLIGIFDPSGIKFTDTSQDNQVTGWSADFIVFDTMPKLSTFNGQQTNPMINVWQTILGNPNT